MKKKKKKRMTMTKTKNKVFNPCWPHFNAFFFNLIEFNNISNFINNHFIVSKDMLDKIVISR